MRLARTGPRLTAALTPLALVSCGQLHPVDIPDQARLFVPAGAASSTITEATCPGASDYAAGLGLTMCEADSRRLALLRQAARVTNDVALFNSLSWPIGSAVIYEKIRDPSTRLLLPAAIATGLYGFFNSGIPGRDATHRAAAFSLTCAILEYTPYLYKQADFDGDATVTPPRPPGLEQAIHTLDDARQAFQLAATRALRGLEVRPAMAGTRPDSIGQRTGQVASGGRKFTSPEPQLRAWVSRQLAIADQFLALGGELQAGVKASAGANGLRAFMGHTEEVREADLASKRPALVSPQDRAAEIVKGFNTLTAQSGGAALGSLTLVEGAPLQSLAKPSAQQWADFESSAAVANLSAAEVKIARWLTEFRHAHRLSVEARQAVGCPLSAATKDAVAPTAPRASPPGTPSPPASRPTTPATPGETPLPTAPGATG